MKTTAFLFLISSPVALAAPALDVATKAPAFTLKAIKAGSPIHQQEIWASGGQFWIGATKQTTTFCPKMTVSNCASYSSNVTALACARSDGTASTCGMSAAVPGGQPLYIEPIIGNLHFAAPHTSPPAGSYSAGFTYTKGKTDKQAGRFSFIGQKSDGFLACPSSNDCDPSGLGCFPWYIKANLPKTNKDNCLQFEVYTASTNAEAWGYV